MTSPYDPELLLAVRQARADLYEAQAARRTRYLLTGKWTPQLDPLRGRPKDPPAPAATVDLCRADLNAARELAAQSVTG